MFVGREAELTHLIEVLGTTARGGVRAAFVVGDAGSGKTRLLAEARTMAPSERQFGIVGYEAEQNVPLGAAASLLRELGDATLGNVLAGAAESSALEPVRIFESTHRVLRDCGAATVFMDDVQWTDELSRALVHYVLVGANAEQRPFALLAAMRPEATATSFADSVTRALPGGSVTVLQLGPLSRDEGVELAMALDGGLDEARATELWRRSGGVPYWLETLARGGDDSADVEQAVTTRLRRLDGDSIAALATLVVASRPLTPDALAEIQGWSSGRAREAVAGLVAAGVVTQGPALVQPVHDLLREEALARLPDELRLDVHRRLAVFLAGSEDVQSLREAVEHHLRGQLPIADLLERLITHPQRRLLGREGLLSMYEIAGRVDDRSLSLEVGLATLAAELGEHRLAEKLWTAVADTADHREQAARAALNASRAAYFGDRTSAAWRLLARARALCDDEGLAIAIDAHEAGIRRWLDHDVAGGDLLTRRALEAADTLVERTGGLEHLERPELEAVHEALSAGVDAALVENDAEHGLVLSSRLVEVAQRLGEERRLLALLRRGNMLGVAGRVLEAEEDDRAAWASARDRILPAVEIEAGFGLASSLMVLGRLEEAESIGTETAALARRSGQASRMSATPYRLQRIPLYIQLSRGDWRSALGDLRAAADEDDDPHRRLDVHRMIGLWLARVDPHGSRDEVLSRILAAQQDADLARCNRCRGEVDLRGAEALARVGHVERARAILEERHGAADDGLRERLWRAYAEAMLAAAEGEWERSCDLLRELLDITAAMGFELERVWVELDLAAALADVQRADAIRVSRSAAERAERIGANTQQALAVQRLRSLGVRAWRRGAAGDALTKRELQIAELVARGASNPEIAQALFLSRKTVERHVSNILRKVGARNRAELAARLGDHTRKVEGAPR